jgi:hypothetical protein
MKYKTRNFKQLNFELRLKKKKIYMKFNKPCKQKF